MNAERKWFLLNDRQRGLIDRHLGTAEWDLLPGSQIGEFDMVVFVQVGEDIRYMFFFGQQFLIRNEVVSKEVTR